MNDGLLQTLVLQTCLSLVEKNPISSPWIIIWEPFLQSLIDVADAMYLLMLLTSAFVPWFLFWKMIVWWYNVFGRLLHVGRYNGISIL